MSESDYRNSGIPVRHMAFRPAGSLCPIWSEKYAKIKLSLDRGAISAILGTRGCGKTQMAACLLGHVAIELDRAICYVKAMEIFLRIREAMRVPGDSERMAIQEYLRPFLLVIDAFEVRSDTDFENRIMDHIIDKRYDAVRPTIIVSNTARAAFEKQIGPSICDRITETGGICELTTTSFRRAK